MTVPGGGVAAVGRPPAAPQLAPDGELVDAGGVSTHHHVVGDRAAPAVVLLHGSGPGVTAWANWRFTVPLLADHLRVHAPDLLGFGRTGAPADGRYDLDRWLDHLGAYLDAVGLDRFHLVGNSFGGALALAWAARHPDRVDRLVLMGSVGVPFELTDGLDAVWGYEPSVAAMRRLVGLFAHDQRIVTDELVRARYEASLVTHDQYAAMFAAPRQRHIDALVTPDEVLRSLPHRTLVVHGRDDRVIPLSTSLHLATTIDDCELHVFGRCGHWTQLERRTDFATLVTHFLTA